MMVVLPCTTSAIARPWIAKAATKETAKWVGLICKAAKSIALMEYAYQYLLTIRLPMWYPDNAERSDCVYSRGVTL